MSVHMLVGAGIQVTCLQPCHLQRQTSHTAVLHRFVQLQNTAPDLSILEDHKTDKLRLRYHTLPNLRYSGDMFPFCRRTTSIQLFKHTKLSSARLRVTAGQKRSKLSSAEQHCCLWKCPRGRPRVCGGVEVTRYSKTGRLWHY